MGRIQYPTEHVIIARHGDYERGSNKLTPYGVRQIRGLAAAMAEVLGEIKGGHHLLSSTSPRALESADIIADVFGISSRDKRDELVTGGGCGLSKGQIEAIGWMLMPYMGTHRVITVMAHHETVESYPNHVLADMANNNVCAPRPNKGEGIYVNLGTGDWKKLSRVAA